MSWGWKDRDCCRSTIAAASLNDQDEARCSCGRVYELAPVMALEWKEVLA